MKTNEMSPTERDAYAQGERDALQRVNVPFGLGTIFLDEEGTKLVATRVPDITYVRILDRAKELNKPPHDVVAEVLEVLFGSTNMPKELEL